MALEDVFCIEGRGTVATGRIERSGKVGEEVELIGLRPKPRNPQLPELKCSVNLDEGQAGDNVGLL